MSIDTELTLELDMTELCPDCLKSMGEEVEKKHPPASRPIDTCCHQPDDCAEFLSGKCSGSLEKD